MAFLIHSEGETGEVSFPQQLVQGLEAPARVYAINNHQVVVDGYHDLILAHDAQVIILMDGYRLADAQEQDDTTSKKQKKTSVKEADTQQNGG